MKFKIYKVVFSVVILVVLFTGCRQLLEGTNDPGFITTNFEAVEKIIVTSPVKGDIYAPGDLMEIKWLTSFSSVTKLNILLYRKSILQRTIIEATQNVSNYFWRIPDVIDNSINYTIKLVNSNNPEEFNHSGRFGIINDN